MSYIPRSRVIEPLSDGSITLLILPEQPATTMPIRVWWNGQRMAGADYTVDGDTLTLHGDFAEDNFEIDYFVAVASFVPRTARVQGVVNGIQTRLSLPELPVDTLPVAVHAGGQRLSLLDYSVSGAVVVLNDVWEGYLFDVDYYVSLMLVAGVPAPDDGGNGDGGGFVTQTTGVESYIDPFNVNLSPLSLPLPDAFSRVVAALETHPRDDHIIVRVSSHSWEDFYRRLLTASRQFPDFLNTAVNVQQRFGFASSPAPDTPTVSVILAGDSYAPIGDWVGRYDQVYSAVLVLRYTAGTVPEEFRS